MSLKGKVLEGHIPNNLFTMIVIGGPPLTPTKVSGVEEELAVAELPDRTVASDGQTNATEVEIEIPTHHHLEQAFMELWFRESQEPVLPSYKKAVTLVMHSVMAGVLPRVYSLAGVFPKMRKMPDLEMAGSGEMTVVAWTLSVDDVTPV